jgi:hypothetical protein
MVVNIIIEKMNVHLVLSKPKPTPYNLRMANQTIAKPLDLIKDLRILVHGIPYVVTFTLIQRLLYVVRSFLAKGC